MSMSPRAQAALRLVNELPNPLSQAMAILDATGWLITPDERAELETNIPRAPVDHRAIADRCKSSPGQWVELAAYNTGLTARQIASMVRRARLAAYAPAGAFEARAAGGQVEVRFAIDAGLRGETP
jgi:hypothetical protein